MNISKTQAAGILALTEDELMYLHQQGRLKAGIDQDTMNWQFDINEVLSMKVVLDKEAAELAEEAKLAEEEASE
jgi:hypothetical protein